MLTSRSLYNRGLQTCEKAGSTKPPLSQTLHKRFDKIFLCTKKGWQFRTPSFFGEGIFVTYWV